MIQAALEARGEKPDVAPPLAEYDGVAERLDVLIDATNRLYAAFVAANSAPGKPAPKIPPQPRPQTAFERVAHRRRSAQHQQTVSRVLRRRSREGQ